MREKGRVVRRMNGEQSRNDQHENREAKQHAHRHLNPSEPAHTDYVYEVEENQTADGEKLMIELAADAPPRELDDVIGQRTCEISARTNVRNYLQPRADVSDAEPS